MGRTAAIDELEQGVPIGRAVGSHPAAQVRVETGPQQSRPTPRSELVRPAQPLLLL